MRLAHNGQTMTISQNPALFSLLGTTYGGDGRSTFGLPNLQGSFPITSGQAAGLSSYQLGQTAGTSAVTLAAAQIPLHTHTLTGQAAPGDSSTPAGEYFAQLSSRSLNSYGTDSALAAMSVNAVGLTGGSQPHNNLSPYLVVNYCICLNGIFPQRS